MRLRRLALSFPLLIGLSLGALSPARAAEDPASGHHRQGPGHGLARHLADGLAAARDDVPASARDELAEVQDLFEPKTAAERSSSSVGEGAKATLALRDLAVAEGNTADGGSPRVGPNSPIAPFQRPWDDGMYETDCDLNICVHWKSRSTSPNDPDAATDEFAHQALQTLVKVSTAYTTAGYRQPKPDGPRPDGQRMYGGSAATDVYLADIGRSNLYGYCTADRNDDGAWTYGYQIRNTRRGDLPAFCVFDNDFAEFPGRQSNNLRVTAAHEYFHAVQFGYDFFEDRWFMEATATWAEDEVEPDVNDNLQYLRFSQLRHPGVSLDTYNGVGGGLHYGDWIFFRYLTERFPTLYGGMPRLMLDMWNRADSVYGVDQYSIQAVANTLRSRGASFPRVFALYAAANRHPATAYREGRVNHYPTAAPRRTVRLKPAKRKASGTVKVNHLASATVRFVPKRLKGKRKLVLSVDMAHRKSGSQAVALVFFKDGRVATRVLKLSRSGKGRVRVAFNTRTVRAVELTLVNANRRYKRCSGAVDGFSCGGVPARDRVKEIYSARVR